MSLSKIVSALGLVAVVAFSGLAIAENQAAAAPAAAESSSDGLLLGFGGYGLGLGNVKCMNGLRLNIVDREVEQVRGVNLSLWGLPPRANKDAEFTGLTLGGIGLCGGKFTGINLSAGGIFAEEAITGINFGGLGPVSAKGDVLGVSAAFLGVYSDRDIKGINVGGVAVGSERRVLGLNAGGLGVFSKEGIAGLSAGLIIGSSADIAGVNVGVGCISDATIAGITADFFTKANKQYGLDVSLLNFTADMTGLSVSGLWSYGNKLQGLSVSLLTNIVDEQQKGVSVGAVNYAKGLKGVQFGLLNIVASNPFPFRILPLMNCRF